jgi:hypothetical protein
MSVYVMRVGSVGSECSVEVKAVYVPVIVGMAVTQYHGI